MSPYKGLFILASFLTESEIGRKGGQDKRGPGQKGKEPILRADAGRFPREFAAEPIGAAGSLAAHFDGW